MDEDMIDDLPTPKQNTLIIPSTFSEDKRKRISAFKKTSAETSKPLKPRPKRIVDPYLIDSDEEEIDTGIMVSSRILHL